MQKSAALYLRVSTTEQTLENQQRELATVAERHGWNVVAVFGDAGAARVVTSGPATIAFAVASRAESSTRWPLGP
jgi:hypothetical protein